MFNSGPDGAGGGSRGGSVFLASGRPAKLLCGGNFVGQDPGVTYKVAPLAGCGGNFLSRDREGAYKVGMLAGRGSDM